MSIAIAQPQVDHPTLPRVRRLRHLVEAAGLRLVALVIVALPRRVAVALGQVLGLAAYLVLAGDRRVALANLDIAFGDAMAPEEKRRLARAAFKTLGRNLAGLFWSPRLNPKNIGRYVELDPAKPLIERRG